MLAPTHNPGLFARSANLAADISYILEVPESSWQSHPIHVALVNAQPPALSRYVGRIQELAASPDPSRLLAHAYVRYMGDLSGGQFIRRRIAKAYALEDGAGLSFYEFRPLAGGAQRAKVRISRTYRLLSDRESRGEPASPNEARVYLQGCTQSTHGLSESLLSILGVRAGLVVDDLCSTPGSRSRSNL